MNDVIKLDFPAKPDYILAIRLAVSAVAERAGFCVEDIEDLKVATAEGCMLLLSGAPDSVLIKITVKDGLHIDISCKGQKDAAAQDETGELSRCLLEALVDRCDFTPAQAAGGEGIERISFYKKL